MIVRDSECLICFVRIAVSKVRSTVVQEPTEDGKSRRRQISLKKKLCAEICFSWLQFKNNR
jgi:hypothetical protein